MAKRTGLGQGLGALIGDAKPEKEAPVELSEKPPVKDFHPLENHRTVILHAKRTLR